MCAAYTIKAENIPILIQAAMEEYDVFGPVQKRSMFVFDKIKDPARLVLTYDTTILPPKKYFHPQKQVLMRFDLKEKSVEDAVHEFRGLKPRLLVGVHSCDLNGILLLDRVFSRNYRDPYYFAMRENTTIIGINCIEPCEYGFCRSMNTHHVVEGYDLFLTPISEGRYFVHVGSAKGEHLIHMAPDLFKHAGSLQTMEEFKEALRHKEESLPHDFQIDSINEYIDMSFEDPMWLELGEECLNCGTCAMVCPTCYCYDVIDELDLSLTEAERMRKWDTCLFTDFAAIAGGHNFRKNPESRLKYRFYHKMRGFAHDHGVIGCTGCGRCTSACPGAISIKDVLLRVRGAIETAPTVRGG